MAIGLKAGVQAMFVAQHLVLMFYARYLPLIWASVSRMQGASKLNMNPPKPEQPASGLKRQVVYMPSCVTRMMGPALSDPERSSVHEKMLSIFEKAGYEVIYPEVSLLCKTMSDSVQPLPFGIMTASSVNPRRYGSDNLSCLCNPLFCIVYNTPVLNLYIHQKPNAHIVCHLSLDSCDLQGLKSACCGMIFNTKGFMEAAQSQCNSLEQSLLKASDGGNIPIVCDTSPCLGQLKSGLTEKGLK